MSAKLPADVNSHNIILAETPATAAIVSWYDDARRRAMLAHGLDPALTYKSLHLGSFEDLGVELSRDQQRVIQDIASIWNRHGRHGTSSHPDQVPEHVCRILQYAGIPIAIENMERQKAVGRSVEEVELLIAAHDTPGALDLQHASKSFSIVGFHSKR